MTKDEQHIKRIVNSIQLSKEKKALMREKLLEYAAFKPERIADDNRLHRETPQTSLQLIAYQLTHTIKTMPIIAGLFIALLVGGGTSFAAEGAVPGDFLYPVKTEVNENVRGAFAFDAEAQARWEARLAERRLEEGAKLTASGAFSEEHKARLEANFEAHATRVQERIDMIAESDPALAAELSSRFEVSLQAHEAILAQIEAGDGVNIGAFRMNINDHASEIGKLRARTVHDVEAEVIIDSEVAATRMREAAEKSLTNAQSLFARVESELSAEAQTRANAQLSAASTAFAEAETAYENEEYQKAFAGFRNVVMITHHLSVYLRSGYLEPEETDSDTGNDGDTAREFPPHRPFIHITPPPVFINSVLNVQHTEETESTPTNGENTASVESTTNVEVETNGIDVEVELEGTGGVNIGL